MKRSVSIPCALTAVLLVVAIIFPICLQAAPQLPPPAPMRPYVGIGVLLLVAAPDLNGMTPAALKLYDDPAIYRLAELEIATIPRQEWIFGSDAATVPLIVMARKGDWLRVVYDDAGREAWLNPWKMGAFHPWDDFFKDRIGCLLPGLQKRFYQLFREPGGDPLVTLAPRQPFTVTLLDGDWIRLSMPDQKLEGWLRWRDGDGRMLVGLAAGSDLLGPGPRL